MPSLYQLKQLQELFGEIGRENQILMDEGLESSTYDLPDSEPKPRAVPVSELDKPPLQAAKQQEAEAPPQSKPPQKEASPPRGAAGQRQQTGAASQSVKQQQAEVPPQAAKQSSETPRPAPDTASAGSDAAIMSDEPLPDEYDDDEGFSLDNLFDGISDLITDVTPSEELPPLPDIDAASGVKPVSEDADVSDSIPQAEKSGVGQEGGTAQGSVGAQEGAAEDIDDLNIAQLLQGFGDEEEPVADGDFSPSENMFSDKDDLFLNDTDASGPAERGGLDDIPSISDISEEEKASLFPDLPPVSASTDEAAKKPGAPSSEGSAEDIPESNDSKLESLPELEDFLTPIDNAPPLAKAAPKPEEQGKKPVEAINLSENQLNQLLDTIASYPLNLRIACEKIISEEIVEPALLSQFIKLLVQGANAREAAALAGKILKNKIPLPKGYKTGEELEKEQSSLTYIFFHRFFPVIRMSLIIALLAACVTYLSYEFIYKPVRAHLLYTNGYERIEEGDYIQGNRRFEEAFRIHPEKNWFYRYAELFRDEKQYLYAEEKYDELLSYYPRDKKGTLDYAAMETDYLRNYEKADRLIRTNILDYVFDDREGLLALGDINLAWGEYDSSRYEEARLAYAKLLAAYGQTDPVMERMMLYFIRTDQLGEVIPLQNYFMDNAKSKISAPALAELGGYLLDKRFEVVRGVPDEHIEEIEGVLDVLLRAAKQDFSLPEVHYHLARYYNSYGATLDERQMLEIAAENFDAARTESPKRVRYRVDTQLRLARLMIAGREFISAEESLAKGVNIMEDAIERRVVQSAPEFGELYAYLGDLAYFAKSGDMREAVDFYLDAEGFGWAPPEIQYRLGSAYYRLGEYAPAMDRFFTVSMETPYNRRLLNALGTASYMRSDYFAAEGYFKRLINMLENDRNRFPILLPEERPDHREIVERMMIAHNNLGVTYNALAARTGRPSYRAAALGEFAESAREWDALERNPQTLVRAGIDGIPVPGASLPYLNIQNTLYPTQEGDGLLFMQIDKDLTDNSWWEALMQSEGLP
jgi:tetratricopeptide (TPR) repeat protein